MSRKSLVVSLEAVVDQYIRDMEKAAQVTAKAGDAAEKTGRQTEQSTQQSRRGLTGMLQDNEKTLQAMDRTGKWMTTRVTAPIVALGFAVGKTGVAYNALEQRTRAALSVTLGSADAAATQMERLYQFTSTSPFPRQVFIEAQQQLLGFGMAAERIVPTLAAVQDAVAATGGSSQDIAEIVDVLARIQGQGKITGVEIQRLGIRGIDAVGLIAAAANESGDTIRTAITDGAVDANFALEALTAGIAAEFGGAADAVKDTWVGATDRVKAAWRDMSATIVTPFVDPTGGGTAVDAANALADAMRVVEGVLKNTNPELIQAGVGIAGVTAAVGPAVWGVGKLGQGILSTKKNLKELRPALTALKDFSLHPVTMGLTGVTLGVGLAVRELQVLRAGARATTEDLVRGFGQGIDTSTTQGQIEALVAQAAGLRGELGLLEDSGRMTGNWLQRTGDAFVQIIPGMSSTRLEAIALSQDFVDSIRRMERGATDATDIVGEVMGRLMWDMDITEDQVYSLAEALGFDLTTAAKSEAVPALIEAALAAGDMDTALQLAGAAAEGAKTEIELLMEAVGRMIGVNISAEQSAIRLQEGWNTLEEELKGGGKALDLTTEKGMKNRKMLADQASTIVAAMEAEYGRTKSMTAVGLLYEDHIAQLRDVMSQAGFTDAQIDDYIKTLGLTPSEVITQVIANTSKAYTALDRVAQIIGRIPRMTHTTVNVKVNDAALRNVNRRIAESGGTTWVNHAGGWAGTGRTRSALAPIRHDEYSTVLQHGEFTVRASQAAKYGPLLEAINRDAFRPVGHDGVLAAPLAYARPLPAAPAPTAPAAAPAAGMSVVQNFYGNDARTMAYEARHNLRLLAVEAKG